MATLKGQEALDYIRNNPSGYKLISGPEELKAKAAGSGNIFTNILRSAFIDPFAKLMEGAGNIATDIQNERYGTDIGYKPITGTLLGQRNLEQAEENPLLTSAKGIAGIGALAVPGSVGAGFKGAVGAGALGGGLGSFGASDKDLIGSLGDTAKGAAIGGAAGGVLYGAGQLVGRIRDKGVLPEKFKKKAIDWADEADAAVQRQAVGGPAPKKVGGALLEKESSKVAKEFGRPVNTIDDLASLSDDIYAKYGGVVQNGADELTASGVTVSIDDVLKPLQDQLDNVTQPELRKPLETAIENIKIAAGGDTVTPSQLYSLKQEWGRLAKFKYGTDPLQTSIASAYDDAYVGANDLMEKLFDGKYGSADDLIAQLGADSLEGKNLAEALSKAKKVDVKAGTALTSGRIQDKALDRVEELVANPQKYGQAGLDELQGIYDDIIRTNGTAAAEGNVGMPIEMYKEALKAGTKAPSLSGQQFREANKYLTLARKQDEWVTSLAAKDRIQLRMNDPFQDRIGAGALLGFVAGGGNPIGAAVGGGATLAANQAASNPNVQRGAIDLIRRAAQGAPTGAGLQGAESLLNALAGQSGRIGTAAGILSASSPSQAPTEPSVRGYTQGYDPYSMGGYSQQPQLDFLSAIQVAQQLIPYGSESEVLSYAQALMKQYNEGTTTLSEEQQTLDRSLAQLEQLYGLGTDQSLAASSSAGIGGLIARLGQDVRGATSQDFRDRLNIYNNAREQAVGLVNQLRGAGVLNEAEREQMIATLPNENSTEREARAWFDNIRQLYLSRRIDPMQQGGQDILGVLGGY